MDPSINNKIVVPGQYIIPTYKLDPTTKKPVNFICGKGTIINEIENNQINKTLPIICSTIVGKTFISKLDTPPIENSKDSNDSKDPVPTYVVNVYPKQNYNSLQHQDSTSTTTITAASNINLPKENDIVLVKVTRISQKQLWCEILAIDNKLKSNNILRDSGLGSNGSIAHSSIPPGGGSQHNHNQQTIASSLTTTPQAQIYDLGENFKGIIRSQDIRSTERDKIIIGECFKPGDILRASILSLGDGNNYYLTTARNDLGVVFAKSEGGAGSLMYPVDWQNMIDLETGLIEKRKNANPFV
ncbi:CSL4 [Candida pseudojiufengensis]|uniref:CSL4 n=1 Tax=Candida pseudojiufengensis TaxID=497109 RepID=UPI0022256D1A|nr:CSL4 [Candida pseudojiufengensis]KAI5966440.1 CSL4 [Candida pseudojiufengensis]